MLARWLSLGIRVFILDEPTRGIDVRSKAEIYQIMSDLAEQADRAKTMLFADLLVERGGEQVGVISPAKFVITSYSIHYT